MKKNCMILNITFVSLLLVTAVCSAQSEKKTLAPSVPTVSVSPSSVVPQGIEVTVTIKSQSADPNDVLMYRLFTKNGTFSEFIPLFAKSASSYLPNPLVSGRAETVLSPFGGRREYQDVDGVLTFTADAPVGKYDIGADVTVLSGPNKKGHSRSSFSITVVPLVDPVYITNGKRNDDPRFDFDIVLGKDAIPSEVYAAKEFQKYFADASGVLLPIVSKVKGSRGHIFIGKSKPFLSSNVGFETKKMGQEDLRIRVKGNNISIAGGRPRGTLYGVYTFLEDYLGIRFLTKDHTYVPKLKNWPLSGPIDKSFSPPLEFRWSYYRDTNINPCFAAKLRCNTIPKAPKYGGATGRRLINHSFYKQIPTSKYGKEHPEYFAFVKGRRIAKVPGNNDGRYTQPCLTNPDVLRIVTENVLAQIKANPKLANVSVSQNDNSNYCRCEKCAAINKREGTPMGAQLTFVNSVADEVAKKYPNVKVGTLAYSYSRKAPKTIKPRPNVQIQLCSLDVSVTKPIENLSSKRSEAFRKDLEAWGRICKDICIWYYNVNFYDYLLPSPNLRVLEPNIRFFVANGVRGVFMQAAYTSIGTEFSDLRNYVTSRLLWNPKLSGQKLIDEFLDLHYGKAAPPIRRFINLLHDHAEAQGLDVPFDAKWKQLKYNKSIAEAGLKAFREAMLLADNDVIRERVEKASICAYRMAIQDAYVWNLKSGPLPKEIANRTRPYVKRLFELCDKYGVTNFTEGLTIEPRTDSRKWLGYRAYFRKLFGIKKGEGF